MGNLATLRLMLQIQSAAERRVVIALVGMEMAGHALWNTPISYFKLGRAIAILSRPHRWRQSNREISDGLTAAEADGFIVVERGARRAPITIRKGERLLALELEGAIRGATRGVAPSEGSI